VGFTVLEKLTEKEELEGASIAVFYPSQTLRKPTEGESNRPNNTTASL